MSKKKMIKAKRAEQEAAKWDAALAEKNKLPLMCYVFIAGNCPGYRIGLIKRGVSGYYPTDFDSRTANEEIVKMAVNDLNKKLGVSKEQGEAMIAGSMWGWDVPGAKLEV